MNLLKIRLHHRDQLPHADTAKTSCFFSSVWGDLQCFDKSLKPREKTKKIKHNKLNDNAKSKENSNIFFKALPNSILYSS